MNKQVLANVEHANLGNAFSKLTIKEQTDLTQKTKFSYWTSSSMSHMSNQHDGNHVGV